MTSSASRVIMKMFIVPDFDDHRLTPHLDGVEDLVAAVLLGDHLGKQSGRVVAAALRGPRPSRGRASVLRVDPQGDACAAVGEVGAGRGRDDPVLDVLGGPDTQEGLGGEHVGTHVEAGVRLGRRHPRGVGADEVRDTLDEQVCSTC